MPSPLDTILNPGAPQLKSPWANLAAEPFGYIGGKNGENVIQDYQAGGKFSSKPNFAQRGVISSDYTPSPTGHYVGPGYTPEPTGHYVGGVSDQNLQTLASGGQNHLQAWQSGNASPVKIQQPFQGMPQQLADVAQKNLASNDAQVAAFNEKAKAFSWGSAHSSPITNSFTGGGGTALDRGAYNQTPNSTVQPAQAARPAGSPPVAKQQQPQDNSEYIDETAANANSSAAYNATKANF